VHDWVPCGYPLVAMMNVERRKGKNVPVIKKALTELSGMMFEYFQIQREIWEIED
jgi:diphosphate-dependent phosphofructokinase